MFEKKIKFIADFNLNKVKSFGSFISFERLFSSPIHPAVMQYISAEMDYLISEDRKRLLQDSVFDYSGSEAAKYFSLIAQEVKKNKKISFEDLKNLVIQAVSFNLNFLTRPRWSLLKLIYNDKQNRSIEEIKLNLNYIYFYDYIKSIFLSYISKRKLTTISITEFELILNNIDKELFANQPQKLVDYSLYSMAEFFNLGNVSKTKIPLFTLELFLKEKNLMEYLFRLRKAFPEIANQSSDVDEIKNIIYSSVPAYSPKVKPEEEVPEKEILQENEEILPGTGEENTVLPLWEESESLLPADIAAEESMAEDVIDEKAEEEIDEEIAKQKIEEEIVEKKIKEVKERDIEENPVAETADEERIETIIETEEWTIPPGTAVTEEEIKSEDISNDPVDSLTNEDFFSLFSDEIKKIEENDADVQPEAGGLKAESKKKDDVDSFLDFEEETESLLRAFKETEEEMNSKDIDFFQDKSSATEKAAIDLIKDFHEESDKNDITAPPVKENNNSKPDEKTGKFKEKNRNILDSISNNDVEKIIFNVFNNDKEDFAGTIEKLNECANYDEATEILKGVFLTYRVNPYTKDALTLTNSIANYFTRV